jgi:hypothetical protein
MTHGDTQACPCTRTGTPKPYELGSHFGIDYDHKKMIARSGKIEIPTKPHGSSGGGIFRLGTFEEINNGTATPTLIGIATTVKSKCLLGTNIAYALAMIGASYSHLSDVIPQSDYCQFTVEIT